MVNLLLLEKEGRDRLSTGQVKYKPNAINHLIFFEVCDSNCKSFFYPEGLRKTPGLKKLEKEEKGYEEKLDCGDDGFGISGQRVCVWC